MSSTTLAGLRRSDFHDSGDQYCFWFVKKGGKSRQIPVRHDLQWNLIEYLVVADMMHSRPQTPLFRTAIGRTQRRGRSCMTAGCLCLQQLVRFRRRAVDGTICPGESQVLDFEGFVRVKQAAALLGVSPNTVRAWGADGKVPEYRHPVNNYRLYKLTDLERILSKLEKPVSGSSKMERQRRSR